MVVVVANNDDHTHNNNTTTTPLKRRNSLPTTTINIPPRKHTNGNHHHHHHHHRRRSPPPSTPSFPSIDFELKSQSSDIYTSLKDILPWSPSSILSPTPAVAIAGISASSAGSGYEISIRNRLVKQAAWAYLQPTLSSSPSSSSRGFCFSGDFFRPIIANFRRVLSETAARVYDWLVDALWLILCR
ncbi:hypothetical protein BVRB_7g158300 [Beta vulgaris subsp. vulgaris]|nr:hypothetical protein BVRB_7g158300 [Beta vulgaris subsp. vulgaris]